FTSVLMSELDLIELSKIVERTEQLLRVSINFVTPDLDKIIQRCFGVDPGYFSWNMKSRELRTTITDAEIEAYEEGSSNQRRLTRVEASNKNGNSLTHTEKGLKYKTFKTSKVLNIRPCCLKKAPPPTPPS
ncbi:hypothetical protein PFISCL1PPCAC_21637, partial [Pristionchus fissidentatus]